MARRDASSQGYALVERELRRAGIQPTAQRIAICSYVLYQADHPCVDEVKSWVDRHFPKISLATVYNTLNMLVEAKLLRAVRLPNSDKVRFDSHVQAHAHFLDEMTGELEDLDAGRVEIGNRLGPEYEVEDIEVLVRGVRRGDVRSGSGG